MSLPVSLGLASLESLYARVASDPRLTGDLVTRPHPLLVAVRRGASTVVLAPAAVSVSYTHLTLPTSDLV